MVQLHPNGVKQLNPRTILPQDLDYYREEGLHIDDSNVFLSREKPFLKAAFNINIDGVEALEISTHYIRTVPCWCNPSRFLIHR
jgi:hypothetical protein